MADKVDLYTDAYGLLTGDKPSKQTFRRIGSVRRPSVPCYDCSNGYCTMNCGPPLPLPALNQEGASEGEDS